MKIVTKTQIREFPLLSRGKVRDIYEIDPQTLLIVTTDRMSAFDVIMNEPIPYKGVVLNQITLFWMDAFKDWPQPPPGHGRARLSRRPGPARRRTGRPVRAGPQGQAPAHRVHRPRLPDRVGLQGLQGHGQGVRAQAAPGTWSIPTSWRRRCSPRRPRRTLAHDENITVADARSRIGDGLLKKIQELTLAIYSSVAATWPRSAGSSSPTPNSSSA
jgi:phosphoribosylaminoimidazole-succinocarboxamide synthase